MAKQVFVLGEGKVITAVATRDGVPAIVIVQVPDGKTGTVGDPAHEHTDYIMNEGTFIVMPTFESACDILDLIKKSIEEAQKQLEGEV